MAKKGEQLPLIDVQPEEAKKIVAAARRLKEISRKKVAVMAEETAQKKVILELVEEAKLQPLPNGVIEFALENVEIRVEPRDDKVKVTELD